MTTWSLFPSTSGPASPVSYSGPFLAGVCFKVTSGGMWFTGYRIWVPGTNGDTVARKFALWAISAANTGVHLPAGDVASGTLTAGQWNLIPLTAPVPLAIGMAYVACTGWTAVHGFPDSDIGTDPGNSYGPGGNVHGVTQGPLFAFSDIAGDGGLAPEPYGTNQGLFSAALGTDPTVRMPNQGSNSGNFWMDVTVTDVTAASYPGPYRLWPNSVVTTPPTVSDTTVEDDVATRFTLSEACTVGRVWYYSPAGVTQLATAVSIYQVTGGGLTGALRYTDTSPAWSGAAGSGWISVPVTGLALNAGDYAVGVYNGTASEATAKDSGTDYWRNGAGGSGITWGPLSAPGLAAAPLAYTYNGNPAGNPTYSDGTTQKGQSVFSQGPPDQYQYLFAPVATPTAGSTQNYWVDLEVSPVPPSPSPPAGTPPGDYEPSKGLRRARRRYAW